MAQLAIKGHATRGKEVIELLEMLGGINKYNLKGDTDDWFVLNETKIQYTDCLFAEKGFTLEQFLEKYPYKVGDKVSYVKYNDEYPSVYTIQKIRWTGATIEYLLGSSGFSALTKDLQPYKEETVEENIIDTIKESDDRYRIKVNYQFDIKVDEGEYYAVRRKPQYPKTYEECCKVLSLTKFPPALVPNKATYITQFKDFPCFYEIQKLAELIVCRNAYWKIAGKQMGLSEPWEPKNPSRRYVFTIENSGGNIQTNAIAAIMLNRILVFPTKEMRDAFLENFKKLIESCKELL